MKSSILKELQRIELAIRGIDPLADIAELEQAQSDMQALIVALQAEDSSLQAQISGNDSDISALQAADTSLQAQISGNDTDISGHTSRISELEALGGGGGIEGYIYAADVKPQGTDGGTFTAGAWRQRALSTLNTNLTGVTLASNIISGIPAGEYIALGRCPGYRVRSHAATLITSQGEYTAAAGYSYDGVHDDSNIIRRIIFTATATVQIKHRCQVNYASYGLGVASDFGPEIYTELLMLKIG